MFIKCQSCDGDGQGVFGHGWSTCPACNGAGQVARIDRPAPRQDKAKATGRTAVVKPAKVEDLDPFEVFAKA